jgi:heme/copper-type cytochrome/quinol oxidase subunit 2
MQTKLRWLFFLLLVLSLNVEVSAQCAMCKAVLESNMQTGEEAVGKGINQGIIYIMFVPYILLAVVGYFTYRHYHKYKTAE